MPSQCACAILVPTITCRRAYAQARFGASLRHIRERLNSALQLLEHQFLEDLTGFGGKSTALFNDYSYPLLIMYRGVRRKPSRATHPTISKVTYPKQTHLINPILPDGYCMCRLSPQASGEASTPYALVKEPSIVAAVVISISSCGDKLSRTRQ
jgi:hypothetical protein